MSVNDSEARGLKPTGTNEVMLLEQHQVYVGKNCCGRAEQIGVGVQSAKGCGREG